MAADLSVVDQVVEAVDAGHKRAVPADVQAKLYLRGHNAADAQAKSSVPKADVQKVHHRKADRKMAGVDNVVDVALVISSSDHLTAALVADLAGPVEGLVVADLVDLEVTAVQISIRSLVWKTNACRYVADCSQCQA